MKARIAAAVARKAKMEGAQQRAVEERRKADERHAALESKHEAKRRLAEEAKERREAAAAVKKARIDSNAARDVELRTQMGTLEQLDEAPEYDMVRSKLDVSDVRDVTT
jgi:hypothetical protein